MDLPSSLELCGRLVLAALLGGLIGFERELRDHPAGLRTHITVAIGSALFVIVGAYGFVEFQGEAASTNVVIGVDRVASTVVTGIGFLGGGAILKHGASVKGLTTAGSLWVTSAIGLAAAVGSYTIVIVATVVTLLCLVGLRWPERWIQRRLSLDRDTVVVRMRPGHDASPVVAAIAELPDVRIRSVSIREDDEGLVVEAALIGRPNDDLAARAATLTERPEVQSVEIVP